MQKMFLMFAAISGLLATGMGAFGAHMLKGKLEVNLLNAYQTAVQYQFYHSLALLIVGMLMFYITSQWLQAAGIAMMIGILFFSGSLYVLALTGIKFIGMITPLGGIAFIAGWLMLFVSILKVKI